LVSLQLSVFLVSPFEFLVSDLQNKHWLLSNFKTSLIPKQATGLATLSPPSRHRNEIQPETNGVPIAAIDWHI